MSRRVLAAASIVAVVVLSGIAAAQGDPPTNTGWWSQDPTAAEQEGGGFQVSGVGGQAVSVAALRFSTPSGVTSATLTLQESGGFVTPATAVQVCRTSDPWEPANPGAFDDAPAPDCSGPVALTRDAEAMTWTADVASLLLSLGGETSLMIVPGETAGGGSPLDPGFQVAFSTAELAVTSAPGTTLAPSTTTTLGSLGGGSGGGGTGSGSGSSFSPPPPSAPPTTLAVTPDTAPADNAPAGGDAFQPPALAGGATPGGGGSDQPWERLLFLVPLSAVAGVAFVYAKRMLEQRGVLDEA